jgi:uncharacterized protein
MALEMRSICEKCHEKLTLETPDVFICSYECTFCKTCTDEMNRVCPNCKGDLQPRPMRIIQDN